MQLLLALLLWVLLLVQPRPTPVVVAWAGWQKMQLGQSSLALQGRWAPQAVLMSLLLAQRSAPESNDSQLM